MSKAQNVLKALGGAENINDIEGCITRLRVEVNDSSMINTHELKTLGAHGIVTAGTVVQVVVGPEAKDLAQDIQDLL